MSPENDGNTRQEGFCWAVPGVELLDPMDVQIIEALLWIDQPLSACDLARILDEAPPIDGHHLQRLAKMGAIFTHDSRPKVGGSTPSYWLLDHPPESRLSPLVPLPRATER